MKALTTLALFLLTLSLCATILTSSERSMMRQMLIENDLDSLSTDFLKDWGLDTHFKIPVVVDILNQPFLFPEYVAGIDTLIRGKSTAEMLLSFSRDIFSTDCRMDDFSSDPKTNDPIDYAIQSWETISRDYQQAWSGLSKDERKQLEAIALSLWEENEDSLDYQKAFEKRGLVEGDPIDSDSLIALIEKIDFVSLSRAAIAFEKDFCFLKERVKDRELRPRTKKTAWGTMCIGGSGDDTYEGRYALIIETGGNDTYRADLYADPKQPFCWVIDLAGNDYYENRGVGGLFSAVMGLCRMYDAQGDDTYRAGDMSFCASFGCGVYEDESGFDIYDCGLHAIGAGSYGLCLQIDADGDDRYSVTQYGEGFAGPLAAGILIDRNGDDLYYAGGKYLHAPLAPFDYRSLSQGFGFGMRPDIAGGIGIIHDDHGNDVYQGGVYAQAVAYWYALGIVIDNEGNDYYDAVYYPQGSGIHLAAGFLFDGAGEDHYYSKHGPGQGAGHDYGVGFMIDRGGNDYYGIEGGNGLGLTNSVGVFMDVWGDDEYARDRSSNYGYANSSRGCGGIGIFLDTGGKDLYGVEEAANDSTWVNGTWGLGRDVALIQPPTPIEEEAEEQAALVDSMASIEEIFNAASEWGVGSAKMRVEKAGEILLDREEEAAEFIFNHRMNTKSGLVYRAISKFADKSDALKPYFSRGLHSPDSLVAKTMISLISESGDSVWVDSLYVLLQEKKYVPRVLGSLGGLKCERSIEILCEYCGHESEMFRVIAAKGLRGINSVKTRQMLRDMRDDSSFLVRSLVRLSPAWKRVDGKPRWE